MVFWNRSAVSIQKCDAVEKTEGLQEKGIEIMRGTFTGIGVGPGDPELLTLKAARLIRDCCVAAVPVSDPGLAGPVYEEASGSSAYGIYLEKCAAYQIALNAVPELAEKAKLFLPMPMIKDKEVLRKIHDTDASAAEKILDEGKDIIFLTLGDPTVYSTCMYVHKRLARAGYPTALVPGITSFCAAAARLDMPLAENREEIHILPASYGIEDSLHLAGTKILMKAGRKMPEVKKILVERNMDVRMVQNCGMKDEQIFKSAEEIPEQAGYYSLLIVKEGKGGEKR